MWTKHTEPSPQRGAALIGVMLVILGLFGLTYAAVTLSGKDSKDARNAFDEVRVRALADSAVEQTRAFLDEALAASTLSDPLGGISAMFDGGATTVSPLVNEPIVDDGSRVGSFTASIALVSQSATDIVVRIDATGYMGDAASALDVDETGGLWSAVSSTVRYALGPSEVFNYAYFINNWGWFYGNTIFCNGNARSNGQFDVAGYAPTVTGTPMYGGLDWDGTNATLIGYMDDNSDGLADGNDGGVFSGWDIVKAENLKGNGGKATNQHDFVDQIEMPNLTNLDPYKADAIAQGGNIKRAGLTVTDPVYGDEPGEKQNLYLVGTAANPIVLDGPVVVEGDVIISGYVTGQGSIYAGGSVYMPNSVQYVNPPTTLLPASNTQADTEAWLSANWNKDFLGLFATENIVVGDYTNSSFKSWVGGWMTSSMNKSEEDAGEDGIPNTYKGVDGYSGTSDDDILEDDNVWTTEVYTAYHETAGMIPVGYSVGDPIPGTGEDIDGDGKYDKGSVWEDLAIADPLNTTYWGGNMPASGVSKYSDIATLYANKIDAALYTNHSFCWVTLGSSNAQINGSLVTRNENIVYGTPKLEFNYDRRLLGGNSGFAAGLLPRSVQPAETLRWTRLDSDPNRYVAMPGVVNP